MSPASNGTRRATDRANTVHPGRNRNAQQKQEAPAIARRFSSLALAWAQKSAMLLAAAVLVWRASVARQRGCCH